MRIIANNLVFCLIYRAAMPVHLASFAFAFIGTKFAMDVKAKRTADAEAVCRHYIMLHPERWDRKVDRQCGLCKAYLTLGPKLNTYAAGTLQTRVIVLGQVSSNFYVLCRFEMMGNVTGLDGTRLKTSQKSNVLPLSSSAPSVNYVSANDLFLLLQIPRTGNDEVWWQEVHLALARKSRRPTPWREAVKTR